MKKSRLWTKDYILILLACSSANFTTTIFMVVFPVYVNNIGGNNAITGMMLSALMISGLITRIIIGPLSDRFGRRKILILGSTFFAVNTIGYCFITSIPGIFLLRVFNGISQGIYFPIPPTLIGDIAPKNRLVDGLGYFGAATALTGALAPVVGLKIYQSYGSTCLFIVSSVFTVISVIFTLFVKGNYTPSKSPAIENNQSKFKLPKISAVIEMSVIIPSVICLIISFGNSSVVNFLSTCGISRRITSISLFFLINNIMVITTRVFTGKLTNKFGIPHLISFSCISIIISTAIIAFSFNIIPIVIASILFGIGVSIIMQLLQTIMLNFAGEDRKGVANSTFMTFGDIGSGMGAMVWGALSEYGGYAITYILSAFSIVIALFIHLRVLIPKLKKTNV